MDSDSIQGENPTAEQIPTVPVYENMPPEVYDVLTGNVDNDPTWSFSGDMEIIKYWHKNITDKNISCHESLKVQGEGNTLRWHINQGDENILFFLKFDPDTQQYKLDSKSVNHNGMIISCSRITDLSFFYQNPDHLDRNNYIPLKVKYKYTKGDLAVLMNSPAPTFKNFQY